MTLQVLFDCQLLLLDCKQQEDMNVLQSCLGVHEPDAFLRVDTERNPNKQRAWAHILTLTLAVLEKFLEFWGTPRKRSHARGPSASVIRLQSLSGAQT